MSAGSATVGDMENSTLEDPAERLMLGQTLGICPDCGDERILLAVAETEYCCTTCDGAVFVLDGIGAAALVMRRAS
jgi:ribosomal protein S27E